MASRGEPPEPPGGRTTGLVLGVLLGLLLLPLGVPSVVSGWDEFWVSVPLAALGGALLAPHRLGRRLLSAATLIAAIVWAVVVFTPFTLWFTRGLCRVDTPQPADAVFVFSSRVQHDGELTSVAMARLVHGLELLGEGLAPRLVLSELGRPGRSYSAAARTLMDHLGLHQEILTIGPVWNTHDEAVRLAALARSRGWTRILAVTSPLHSRRACSALEAQGLAVVSSPAMETSFDLETLDREDERMASFRATFHERLGLFVYRWRGWLAPPAPASTSR
ncbi:MAG TPA: YdcF family protein [Vicinamibacteria bacterium]|nr:YdcF family protein [Vicinamibacteria bacterium]